MGWQGTQAHETYAATKHQQLLLLPPPRMDHASPPLAAAIAVANCAFVASPPPALRSLHLSSTYSGVEVLSFFLPEEAKGRTRPCTSRRGWRNCRGRVGEKRREGRWVRRGGLVAASCCFDPVDSGVGGRPFRLVSFFFCVVSSAPN
jgi:hypothetical protein